MEEPIDHVERMTTQQPTRSGDKKADRRFDKTQLHSRQHGRYVHRDYASHFFRWGWVARHIKRASRILDIGCGQELPLMWVISGNMSIIPEEYVGVDLNKVPFSGSPKWATIVEEYNFVDDYRDLQFGDKFDYATNFEVIEHMMPSDGLKLLQGIHHWLKPTGKLFLSTPVFNGQAAKNHVHEYEIPELKELCEAAGFRVEARYGTFASANDIRRAMSPGDGEVYDKLYDYYGGDVMSTFLAPLYPDASRNNMWVLVKT
jgi:2-polyprenyl-3-methyl-5-hydroxy-6-metoxy-1,4-benzoquinol methylase